MPTTTNSGGAVTRIFQDDDNNNNNNNKFLAKKNPWPDNQWLPHIHFSSDRGELSSTLCDLWLISRVPQLKIINYPNSWQYCIDFI